MASSFNLTAQLNIRGPSNLKPIVAEIRRELGSVSADVKIKLDNRATRSIDSATTKLKALNAVLSEANSSAQQLNATFQSLSSALGSIRASGDTASSSVAKTAKSFQQTASSVKIARTEIEEFGRQSFIAIKRFAAFSIPTAAIFGLTNAITNGFKAFIQFDKELVKLQQVTGQGAIGIKALQDEITRLSTSLGVSSESLTNVATTLAQAGLSAKETRIALEALAKTDLAPSFDNLTETTEGAIAAMRQFGLQASDLEAALGSINAVAAAFAVESADIITAIQRTGGVFASASKGVSQGKDALNEFIAVFTSVRATTRESAETIATGLRTIFTRIQRASTIQQLKEFGVNLQDLEGKFVGPYEAVRRLSEALSRLDPRDVRFSTIVEELGGFRQIGKVIPLIQQFATAQQALAIAQKGQGSLTDAQVKAQQSLANQLAKVREQFLALIRDIGQSTAFVGLFKIVTGLASSLLSLASAFKPILPILAIFGAIKGVSAISQFATGFFGGFKKGGGAGGAGKNIGETLSGAKEKERSEATSRAADAIRTNTDALKTLTTAVNTLNTTIKSRGSSTLSGGGRVLGFNSGGVVPGSGRGDKIPAMLEPGEVVMSNRAAQKYGRGNLVRMNKYADGGVAIKTINSIDNVLDGDSFDATVTPKTKQFKKRFRVAEWDAWEKPSQYNPEGKSTVSKEKFQTIQQLKQNRNKIISGESVKTGIKIPGDTIVDRSGQTAIQLAEKATEVFASKLTNLDTLSKNILPGKEDYFKRSLIKGTDIPEIYKTGRTFKFNLGGKIQKFMAGSVGGAKKKGIDWESLNKGRGSEESRGARPIAEPISTETYLKWAKDIYAEYDADPSLVRTASGLPPEIDLANMLLAQIAFETSGAGLKVGQRFVRTPKNLITDELKPYLIADPSDPSELGFYEDIVAKFLRPKQMSKAATAKLGKDYALKAATARLSSYADAESAISEFKRSGVLNIDPDIMSYIISSIADPTTLPLSKKDITSIQSKLTPTNLEAFKALIGKDKIPVSVQGQRTKLSEVFGAILETYGSDTSDLEVDNIIRGLGESISKKEAKKLSFGGLIQKFMAGSVGSEGVQPPPPDPKVAVPEILKKLEDVGGSRRARELLTLPAIERAIATVVTSTKRPRPANVFDKTFLNSQNAVPFLSTLSALADQAIAAYDETTEADFHLTPEQIAAAKDVAIAGIRTDMKDLTSYYRLRKGYPFHVHTGIISPNKYPIIEKLLEQQHMLQVEAARSLAPNETITPLSKQERIKFGEDNLGGYNLEALLALFGSGNGKKTTTDAIDFSDGLTPLAASIFNVPAGIPTQAKLTISSRSITKALDGIISTFKEQKLAFGGKADGPGFEEIRQQIIDKYPEIDFRISKRKKKYGFGYNLMGALKSKGGLSAEGSSLNFQQPTNLKQLVELSDKLAQKLMGTEGFADGGKAVPSVNEIGSQIAEQYKLAQGNTTAFNQLENNCLEIANEVATRFGYMSDPASIRKQLEFFQQIRLGKNSPLGIKPTEEMLKKNASVRRLVNNPTSAASSGNILIRESDELMKHVSFEHKNKEYNFGAAGKDWPIVLRIPLRKKEEKFAGGGSPQNTVPAMVSNNEGFVPPKLAKKIGYAKLDRMNQADRNGMTGFAEGGISKFKGPGSGTSDSIGPIGLPKGSYVIRAKAMQAMNLHKGGVVSNIRRFADGGDVGSSGDKLQTQKFILQNQQTRKQQLENERQAAFDAGDDAAVNSLTKKIQSLESKIADTEATISAVEAEFKDLEDELNVYNKDLQNAGTTLRDSIRAQVTALTGNVPDEAKIEEIYQRALKTGGVVTSQSGKTVDVRREVQELRNKENNVSNAQERMREKFGDIIDTRSGIEDRSVPDFIQRKQSALEEEKTKKKELETRAADATGAEKAFLNDQIQQSSRRIDELNTAIEGARQSYDIISTQIEEADKQEKAAQAKLEAAQQAIIDALRKRAKDFDTLSPERQQAAVEEVLTTGAVTDKTGKKQSFATEFDAVQEAQQEVEKARDTKRAAEATREERFPPTPPAAETLPTVNPQIAKEQNDYIKYKAEQAGMSVGGYKYSMAQKVGKNQYDVRREMQYGQQETKNLAAGRARELKGIDVRGALTEGNTSEEAKKVQAIVEELAASIQKANPAMGLAEAREQATKLAEGLSAGDKSVQQIVEASEELSKSLNSPVDEAAVLTETLRRTAAEMGVSVETLKANVSPRQMKQQAFIQSTEGQRFGALAEFAPGLTEKFSKTKIGKGLGAGADFISGKGGALSKSFAKAGGFTGIGAAVAGGAEALKQFLPKSMTSDPNTAGALGALGGAGTGAAMGAQIGSFAGPIGTLIGGVGGAIIGGIQGFFSAKNQAILTNALENVARTTGDLDDAFKKLDADASAVNFENAQKAFGDVINASADIESMAMAKTGFQSLGGTFIGGVDKLSTGLEEGDISKIILGGLQTAFGASGGGLLVDYFSAPSEAQKQEAISAMVGVGSQRNESAARLAETGLKSKSTEELGAIFDNIKKGTNELNPITEQYVQGALKAAEAANGTKQLTAEQTKSITAEAQSRAALDAYMKKRKDAGATDEQIGKEISTDRAKAIKDGEETLRVQAEVALKQQLLARATKEVAVASENLIDTYRRITAYSQKYSDQLSNMTTDLDADLAGLSGDTSMKPVNRQNEQILGNVSAYSMEEVRAAANTTAGLLGNTPEAQKLANNATGQKVVLDQIPNLLRNAKTTEDRDKALALVRQQLKEQGVEGTAIDTVLKDLENKIVEGQKSGTGTSESDLQETVQKSFETVNRGSEALQNLAKKYNDTLEQARQYQEKYNKAILESNSYMRKGTQIRLNAELDLAKALGRSPTLQELNKPFDVEVQGLTRGLVDSGKLTADQASDPMAIADAIISANAQKKAIEQTNPELMKAAAGIPAGEEGDALRADLNKSQLDNIKAVGELTVASAEGRQALEKLANDGTKAANALAKIQEEQQAMEGFANFAQNVFTSNSQQLAEMTMKSQALDAAQTRGPDFMKSLFNRQQAFAGLEQEKGFMTPQEYKDTQADLLRKSFEAQGYKGGDVVKQIAGKDVTLDDLIKRVKGGVNEEDPNVKAYREATEVQAKANEALSKINLEQAVRIENAMLELEDFLTNKFPAILSQAISDRDRDSQAPPETNKKPPEPTKTQKELEQAKKEAEARKKEAEKTKKEADAAGGGGIGWGPGAGRAIDAQRAKDRAKTAAKAQKEADKKVSDLEAKNKTEQEAAQKDQEAQKEAEKTKKAAEAQKQTEENKVKAKETLDKAREARSGAPDSETRRAEREKRIEERRKEQERKFGIGSSTTNKPKDTTNTTQTKDTEQTKQAVPLTPEQQKAQAEIKRLEQIRADREQGLAKNQKRLKLARRGASDISGSGPVEQNASVQAAQRNVDYDKQTLRDIDAQIQEQRNIVNNGSAKPSPTSSATNQEQRTKTENQVAANISTDTTKDNNTTAAVENLSPPIDRMAMMADAALQEGSIYVHDTGSHGLLQSILDGINNLQTPLATVEQMAQAALAEGISTKDVNLAAIMAAAQASVDSLVPVLDTIAAPIKGIAEYFGVKLSTSQALGAAAGAVTRGPVGAAVGYAAGTAIGPKNKNKDKNKPATTENTAPPIPSRLETANTNAAGRIVTSPVPVTRPAYVAESSASPVPTPASPDSGNLISINPESLKGLNDFNTTFGQYVDKLVQHKFPAIEGKVQIEHTLNVNMTGAAGFQAIQKNLSTLVTDMMGPAIDDLRKEINNYVPGFPTAAVKGERRNGA